MELHFGLPQTSGNCSFFAGPIRIIFETRLVLTVSVENCVEFCTPEYDETKLGKGSEAITNEQTHSSSSHQHNKNFLQTIQFSRSALHLNCT